MQQSDVIRFDLWEILRMRLIRKELNRINKGKGSRKRCTVILSYGQFWPEKKIIPEPF
jgi:hypothetical protein